MSNQIKTPHRSNIEEEQPFTPCTRLSRLTVQSLTNGDNRHQKLYLHHTPTNLMDRLSEASGKKSDSSTPHRNLVMFFGSDRINMHDKSMDNGLSEDEDSDGDLFSSAFYPMSSPDKPFTKQSIFDDEPTHFPPLEMSISSKRFIFEEDEEDEEEEDHYDPSNSWLSQLFDNSTESVPSVKENEETGEKTEEDKEEKDDEEIENRPPRLWKGRVEQITHTSLLEEDINAKGRTPLQELFCEKDELPAKKKALLASGKPKKIRYMRALSPTRLTQRKIKK